jgi:hypothetical protein
MPKLKSRTSAMTMSFQHYRGPDGKRIREGCGDQAITPKARPAAGNVVNLIDALRASIGLD